MDSPNEMILLATVAVLLLVFLCMNKSEGMNNVANNKILRKNEFDPTSFQPMITEQVKDDGFIVLPEKAEYPWAQNPGGYGEAEILDDGAKGNLSFGYNMCSKSCCSNTYPPPFSVTPDDFLLRSKDEFVPTSYSCTNAWQDAGCLCMTREQAYHLNSRGSNAYAQPWNFVNPPSYKIKN